MKVYKIEPDPLDSLAVNAATYRIDLVLQGGWHSIVLLQTVSGNPSIDQKLRCKTI